VVDVADDRRFVLGRETLRNAISRSFELSDELVCVSVLLDQRFNEVSFSVSYDGKRSYDKKICLDEQLCPSNYALMQLYLCID